MAEDNRINGFGWFLTGLGFGALVGILYAPKSGSETRHDLAREGKEYIRNRSKQVGKRVGTLVDRSKEHVTQSIDRGRTQWTDFVERSKSLVGEQQSRVAATVEARRQAHNADGSSARASGVTSSTTITGTEISPVLQSE